MPKVSINGFNIHYWRIGTGPDMVMIHGLTGNLAVWHLKLVPELRQMFRITTYDLRGHGRSDTPPTGYTTRDMALDLKVLLDALEMDRVYLVGHSLGADIALHFALLFPERADRIVVIEADLPALADIRRRPDWPGWAYWVKMLEKYAGVKVPPEKQHDMEYLLRQSLRVPIIFGPARGLPRKEEPLQRLLEGTTVMQDYEVVGELTLENLSRIQPPVLLVYGSNSQYLHAYDELRHRLPDCTPVLLPGGEHFSPLEQPELLLEHLTGFLGRETRAVEEKSA